MGWWRPEICLPERALSELDRDELESVLAHELAHVLRRDPAWLTLFQVLGSLLFFQPLQQLAGRQWREVAEHLCDDQAVRWTERPLGFARSLTRVASWLVEPAPRAAFGMAAEPSQLRRRVERMLVQDPAPAPARGRRASVLVALVGVMAIPGFRSASAQVTPSEPLEAPDAPELTDAAPLALPEEEQLEDQLEDQLEEQAQAPFEALVETRFEVVPTPTRAPIPTPATRAPAVPTLDSAALQTTELALGLGVELEGLRSEIRELHTRVEGQPALDDVHERIVDLESRIQRLDGAHRRAIELLGALLED